MPQLLSQRCQIPLIQNRLRLQNTKTLRCCLKLWLTCFTVSNSSNTLGVRSIKDITIIITTRNIWAKGLVQLGSNSNNIIGHFTQFYFGLVLFFNLWNWAFKHSKFLRVCVYHLNPFARFTVDNVDLQIFRQKAKAGRGVACTIFALCSRAIFLSTWLHFGKKKVIFTSGNLANWMANSLFMVESPITWSPFRCQNSDFHFGRSMHSVIKDFLKSSIDIVSLMSSVSEFQSFSVSSLMDSSP